MCRARGHSFQSCRAAGMGMASSLTWASALSAAAETYSSCMDLKQALGLQVRGIVG